MLNYHAIMLDVTDWKLAPPASDWRLQVSYIIPFAINTLVHGILALPVQIYAAVDGDAA